VSDTRYSHKFTQIKNITAAIDVCLFILCLYTMTKRPVNLIGTVLKDVMVRKNANDDAELVEGISYRLTFQSTKEGIKNSEEISESI